jgi:hypothetical protein
MYLGLFNSWEDVQQSFNTTYPEPERVFLAEYEQGSYDGHSSVWFYNNKKYYYVLGSHCSCYGLEGQFDPEEYTAEEAISILEKYIYTHSAALIDAIKLNEYGYNPRSPIIEI